MPAALIDIVLGKVRPEYLECHSIDNDTVVCVQKSGAGMERDAVIAFKRVDQTISHQILRGNEESLKGDFVDGEIPSFVEQARSGGRRRRRTMRKTRRRRS
jgi:hypothetical protein